MRPLCLELCAGEGGSTRGLMDAGWDVIAVDDNPNRLARNPARWKVRGDAFDVLAAIGHLVDLTWAGWPCQDYSAGTRSIRAHGGTTGHARLIAAGRAAMVAAGTPYVIENVEGARSELRSPLMLCGRQFALTATDDDGTVLHLDRHRLFESSVFLTPPLTCRPHDTSLQVGGAYGGGRKDKHDARNNRHGGYAPPAHIGAALLQVDWMTQVGQRLAIPPAYSAFLGAQLLAAICPPVTAHR